MKDEWDEEQRCNTYHVENVGENAGKNADYIGLFEILAEFFLLFCL